MFVVHATRYFREEEEELGTSWYSEFITSVFPEFLDSADRRVSVRAEWEDDDLCRASADKELRHSSRNFCQQRSVYMSVMLSGFVVNLSVQP